MLPPKRLIFLAALFVLGACSVMPAQEDTPPVLPTLLVIPSPTPRSQPSAAPASVGSPLASPAQNFAWFPNPVDRTVLGVDPSNRKVVAKILTTFSPDLVAVTASDIWVTQNVDEKTTSLLRINRQGTSVSDDIPLQYGRATSIEAAGASVWLTFQSPDSTAANPLGGVAQVNLQTRKVAHYIQTRGYPLQVAAAPEAAWVLVQDSLTTHFERINSASGEVSLLPSAVQSSRDLQLFARFTLQANGLWATPNQHTSYIFQLDPQTGAVLAAIQVGSTPGEHPIDITSGGQAVYVALENNTIIAVDPVRGTISRPVVIETPIDWIRVMDGTLWAWSRSAATAYQMDSIFSQVTGSALLGSTPQPTPTVISYPTPSIMGGSFKPCDGVDFESNLRPGMKAVVNPDPPLPDRVRISASRNITGWTMEGDGIDHWLLPAPQN